MASVAKQVKRPKFGSPLEQTIHASDNCNGMYYLELGYRAVYTKIRRRISHLIEGKHCRLQVY